MLLPSSSGLLPSSSCLFAGVLGDQRLLVLLFLDEPMSESGSVVHVSEEFLVVLGSVCMMRMVSPGPADQTEGYHVLGTPRHVVAAAAKPTAPRIGALEYMRLGSYLVRKAR